MTQTWMYKVILHEQKPIGKWKKKTLNALEIKIVQWVNSNFVKNKFVEMKI